jgi:hypothetical protein
MLATEESDGRLEAMPVAAGVGVAGVGTRAPIRAGLAQLDIDKTITATIGFGMAVAARHG